MHRLCSFNSPVQAWHAAVALWRRGIVARIYHGLPDLFHGGRGFSGPQFDVLIASKSDAEEALLAIHEAEREAGEAPPAEGDEAELDLSRLDPSLAPPCPGCARPLDLRADLDACTACGRPVDLVEELVRRHGPEALADCYGDPGLLMDPELLDLAAVPCPHCEYALIGLPACGRCPECGQPYDKQAMIQDWLG